MFPTLNHHHDHHHLNYVGHFGLLVLRCLCHALGERYLADAPSCLTSPFRIFCRFLQIASVTEVFKSSLEILFFQKYLSYISWWWFDGAMVSACHQNGEDWLLWIQILSWACCSSSAYGTCLHSPVLCTEIAFVSGFH